MAAGGLMPSISCAWSGSGHPPTVQLQPRHYLARRRLRLDRPPAASSGSEGPQEPPAWFDSLKRATPSQSSPQGGFLRPLEKPEPLGLGEALLGEKGYRDIQDIKRSERQRVWDSMRASAQDRFERGVLPGWFDPDWLTLREAPVNKIMREMGVERYQPDDQWLGRPWEDPIPDMDGGDDGSGSGGGKSSDGGGGDQGWWREDDPYWMLRDWGSHPMRWWTLVFAAILAGGGLAAYLRGSAESLLFGWGAAASLALCSLSMSDMRTEGLGEPGVKAAWAICALMAIKDGILGWGHLPNTGSTVLRYNDPEALVHDESEKPPWEFFIGKPPVWNWGPTGWAAATMCALYMCTGMAGEMDGSLPMNPGGVFKISDVAFKAKVHERWGLGTSERFA